MNFLLNRIDKNPKCSKLEQLWCSHSHTQPQSRLWLNSISPDFMIALNIESLIWFGDAKENCNLLETMCAYYQPKSQMHSLLLYKFLYWIFLRKLLHRLTGTTTSKWIIQWTEKTTNLKNMNDDGIGKTSLVCRWTKQPDARNIRWFQSPVIIMIWRRKQFTLLSRLADQCLQRSSSRVSVST